MSSIFRLALLIGAASGAWLGGATPARADCRDDTECKSPRICDAGACREAQCAADADCLGSQACDRGRCVARASGCRSDVDCPGDQLCVESACRAEDACKSDVDCPGDRLCDGGRCRAGAAATPPPPSAAAPPVTIAPPVAPVTTAGAAAPPPADAPGPNAPGEKPPRSQAKSMFIGAGVLFGAAYFASLPVTAATSGGRATRDAAIPFAGPFLILANHDLTAGGIVYYAADAAFQLTSLLLVGLAIKEATTRGGADTTVRVSAAAPDGRGPGLGLGFRIP